MRIKTLSASGFQAGDFKHDLSPVTAIIGPNFAGKTSRLNAIRVGLLGYLPELGKQNGSTFTLANGPAIDVSIEFDDGRSIGRTWLKERGSVKAVTIGDDITIPPVLLDPSVYFGLGDKDRVRYVFGLADVDKLFTDDTGAAKPPADAIIARFKSIKIEDHNEHHEAAINELTELTDDTDRARHNDDQTVQDWLDLLIFTVRGRLKLAKANADRMAKTVQGLTVIQATDDPAYARNLEAEITKLRVEVKAIITSRATLEAGLKDLNSRAAEAAALEKALADSKDYTADIAKLQAEIDTACDRVNGYKSKTQDLHGKVGGANGRQIMAASEYSNAVKRLEKLDAEHAGNQTMKECPFCGACGTGWKEKLEADYEAKRSAIMTEIAAAEKLNEKATEELDKLKLERTKAEAEDFEHNALQRRFNADQSQIRLLEQRQAQSAAARSRLAELKKTFDVSPEDSRKWMAEKLAEQTEAIEALEAKIEAAEDKQRAFVQKQQDAKRNAQALLERDRVTAEVQVTKQAVDILEALQRDAVTAAFAGLLEHANRFTAGLLRSPLEYRDGELGRFEGSSWVSHRAFSGCEKAVAYAGISTALAQGSPIRIVMLDEMGRVDADNKTKLVELLLRLVEQGHIDQAFLVDTEDNADAYVEFEERGVQVISL